MRDELKKFHETVDILVKAYFNGTLQRMDCKACAVGNIIAAHNGFTKNGAYRDILEAHWPYATRYAHGGYPLEWTRDGFREVESTGYTAEELHRIETVFMINSSCDDSFSNVKNFEGLMATVSVLADIHKVDLTTQKQACQRFVRA